MITIEEQPQPFHPAFNAAYFVFDSDNKTNLGFRYIVDIEVDGDIVATYRLRPKPETLFGEVDISKALQTLLKNDFQQLVSYDAQGHYINYKLVLSEEYFVNHDLYGARVATGSGVFAWPNWSNLAFNPTGANLTQWASLTEPPYVQGDIITINQLTGLIPSLEGSFTVIDKFLLGGIWYLVINLPWIGGGVKSNTATSRFTNGQKFVDEVAESDEFTVWRGAFRFAEFPDYDNELYEMNSDSKEFLTTMPDVVRISRNTQTRFAANIRTAGMYYVQFNISGILYRYELVDYSIGGVTNFEALPTTENIQEKYDSPSWVPFSGTIDLDEVSGYQLQITTQDGVPLSRIYNIRLYSECDFYDKYDLVFIDRLGSYIAVSFNKADYLSSNVTRADIRRKIPVNYLPTDRGKEHYRVEEELIYTVNSGQLSETEYFFYRELLSTPHAYVSINGAPLQAINIVNNNLELLKQRTAKQRNLTIQFTMSTQDPINV